VIPGGLIQNSSEKKAEELRKEKAEGKPKKRTRRENKRKRNFEESGNGEKWNMCPALIMIKTLIYLISERKQNIVS